MVVNDNQFVSMSNVDRYKILEQLYYGNKYKFDIRLLLQKSVHNSYVCNHKNNTYPCLIGTGISLMLYNISFLTSIDYYAYNFYATGFSNYSLLNINAFIGSRFIFSMKQDFFNKFFLTNKLVTEVFLGLERMKVYDAYTYINDDSSIHPCILILLILDYKEKQIGLGLKIKQRKVLHNMMFSSLTPSIIFRL